MDWEPIAAVVLGSFLTMAATRFASWESKKQIAARRKKHLLNTYSAWCAAARHVINATVLADGPDFGTMTIPAARAESETLTALLLEETNGEHRTRVTDISRKLWDPDKRATALGNIITLTENIASGDFFRVS